MCRTVLLQGEGVPPTSLSECGSSKVGPPFVLQEGKYAGAHDRNALGMGCCLHNDLCGVSLALAERLTSPLLCVHACNLVAFEL